MIEGLRSGGIPRCFTSPVDHSSRHVYSGAAMREQHALSLTASPWRLPSCGPRLGCHRVQLRQCTVEHKTIGPPGEKRTNSEPTFGRTSSAKHEKHKLEVNTQPFDAVSSSSVEGLRMIRELC